MLAAWVIVELIIGAYQVVLSIISVLHKPTQEAILTILDILLKSITLVQMYAFYNIVMYASLAMFNAELVGTIILHRAPIVLFSVINGTKLATALYALTTVLQETT
jgi:hypothetical protein